MIIGLFGGTFDPPHKGHSAILKAAVKTSFFDRIIVMPSAVPARKSMFKVSMPSYRFEMVKIWLDEIKLMPDVELSDLELKRMKKSYTLDTVREIKEKSGKSAEVYLICGSDLIFEIDTWHRPIPLLKETGLFVAMRPGADPDEIKAKSSELKERFSAKIRFFDAPYIDVSSAGIREMISGENKYPDGSIHDRLGKWIVVNRIYDRTLTFGEDISENEFKSLINYEAKLRDLLSGERLIHSLNTMRFCIALARANAQKPYRFAVAGLLHDCTKQSPENNEKFYTEIAPEIRHSYSGSRIAKKLFNIDDPDILNAIKYHTTGRDDASLMEKIVFVADKIEPARNFPRIEELREISFRNIDEGYQECLRDIISHIENKGKKAHSDTYAAFDSKGR